MTTATATKPTARFAPEDLEVKTGNAEETHTSEMAAALAKAVATYNARYIYNPAHHRVFAALEEVMQIGIHTAGQRQWGVSNAAPTGSGKTTCLKVFAKIVHDRMAANGTLGEGERPVIIVPLESLCTVKRLWTAVLDAYGDPYSSRGTEELLRKRAYRLIAAHGTKLLCFDEIQHLGHRAREGLAVTDAMKRLLDDGIAPVAFFGTEDARPLLSRNKQLSNRLMPPCDIRPLDIRDEDDRATFKGFVRRLDEGMVKDSLMKRTAGLDDPRVAASLFAISEGVIGRVVNLVRVAFSIAYRRKAEAVEIADLSRATTEWAIAQGLFDHNPFTSARP